MVVIVGPGHRVVIEVPALSEGTAVDVQVTPVQADALFEAWEDLYAQYPDVKAYESAAEADEAVSRLRDEWDS